MHKACPLSELAAGEALRLDTAPPFAVFHTKTANCPLSTTHARIRMPQPPHRIR